MRKAILGALILLAGPSWAFTRIERNAEAIQATPIQPELERQPSVDRSRGRTDSSERTRITRSAPAQGAGRGGNSRGDSDRSKTNSGRTPMLRRPPSASRVERYQRSENVPHRYYWHNSNGSRYTHYYDGRVHWYGFYHGPRFYWAQYHASHWWWFDVGFNRWCYWSDGQWWWPSPTGAVYVYVNNGYYPADRADDLDGQDVVPSQAAPSGRSLVSPDRRRLVQVQGERGEAFLYDNTAGQPAFMEFLGENVESVKFSGGRSGEPLRILLNYRDGTFALFDENGDAVDSRSGLPAESVPPPPAVPPIPAGQ